jgi:excisionase family DNA binding protein
VQIDNAIPAGRTGSSPPPLAYRGPELARLLGICERTLLDLRENHGLPFIRWGKIICYPRAGVRAWLRGQTIQNQKVEAVA